MTEEQKADIEAAVAEFAETVRGCCYVWARERAALLARQHAYGRLIHAWGQRWVLDNVRTIKAKLDAAEDGDDTGKV